MRTCVKLIKARDNSTPMLPEVKTKESCCADLAACFDGVETVKIFNIYNQIVDQDVVDGAITLYSGDRAMIPTGWKMLIEHGYFIKILPRSGLSLKFGITLINSPGTIDSDFTDEVMILLYNASDCVFKVSNGDRIAQMDIRKNLMKSIFFRYGSEEEIQQHRETSDRRGGFGHTGIHQTEVDRPQS